MLNQLKEAHRHLQVAQPLILNLTNTVTRDLMANCLLALGAVPLMCDSPDEIRELAHMAAGININIGTLNEDFLKVVATALPAPCPVILDPVGCGASLLRTQTARKLLSHVNMVRGNASEMMALSGQDTKAKGVESLHTSHGAVEAAQTLCAQNSLTCIISGQTDYVISSTQGRRSFYFGSPLMAKVTGMGCSLTAVIIAFHNIEKDPFTAACLATAFVGLAGSQAAKPAKGPGSFRTRFIDALYAPDWTLMEETLSHGA